jgi:hypothetical protein
MTLDIGRQKGRWWRLREYEVRDGFIRPTPGAKAEAWDPWQAYREARAGKPGSWRHPGQAPYESFLHLAERLEVRRNDEGKLDGLSARDEDAIAAWCGEHGLLGLLLQRTSLVAFVRSMRKARHQQLYSYEERYVRRGGRWTIYPRGQRWLRMGTDLLPLDGPAAKEPITGLPTSWAVVSELLGADASVEPLEKTWARFFPTIPRDRHQHYALQLPGSEGFWKCYAEPVEDFVEAAVLFRDAVGAVRSRDKDQRAVGVDRLDALLSTIAPSVASMGPKEAAVRYSAPSLLATFAMMTTLDLAAGRRPLHCSVCGALFLSNAWGAQYCSQACRWTSQKRRHRRRKEREARSRRRTDSLRSHRTVHPVREHK